jgi:hypothetical protein
LVAVGEVQPKADVCGLLLSCWNTIKGSSRAEMHNYDVAFAEAEEEIFPVPKGNVEVAALEPALSVVWTALEACGIRNDDVRNKKVDTVTLHHATKIIHVG